MMRCLQCGRDYPESQAFCHQCGEPLQPRATPADQPATLGKSELAARRARALARRRAPVRSQSLLFAVLVLLGAGVGLALVWRQAWLPHITVSVTRPPDQRSTAAVPASASEAAKVDPATPPPSAPASPAPTASPAPAAAAPTVEPARPATPPTAVARASEPPAPAAPPSATKRAPEPPTPQAASRPDAPPPADRAVGTSPTPSSTTPKLLSARTDPSAALPTAGARIISLVPVGSATKARGQLVWEPMGGGTLVVSGLPPPPAGRTYQLWLGSIKQGDRVSAGLLAVDAQGAGTLRVAPPRASWSPDIFGVTMERQGGAREPSDDLVLVGEMPKQTATAPAPPPDSTPPASAPGPDKPSASAAPVPPTPPPTATRGPDGQLVRVFSAPVGRSFTVAQSVLRSLGWDIDEANQSTGVIRTEPRNVTYKDFVFYAEGTRQTLSVVVRAVSDTETSISVRRQVYQEERILWNKERKILATPESSSVEQSVLDAIDRLL